MAGKKGTFFDTRRRVGCCGRAERMSAREKHCAAYLRILIDLNHEISCNRRKPSLGCL